MPTSSSTEYCHHVFTTGHRCGSPALRREQFCYFHHPTRRPRRPVGKKPRPPIFHIRSIDDRASIQRALGKTISRVASGRFDRDRAAAMLFILNLANENLPGDPSSLAALISSAQQALDLPQFDPLADILGTILPRSRYAKMYGVLA